MTVAIASAPGRLIAGHRPARPRGDPVEGGPDRLTLRRLYLVGAQPLRAGPRDEAGAFEHPVELHVKRPGEPDPFDAPHFLLPEEDGDEPHRVDPGPLGEIADREAELLHATPELAALEVEQDARPLIDAVAPELRGRLLVAAEVADRGQVGVPPPTFLWAGIARRPRTAFSRSSTPAAGGKSPTSSHSTIAWVETSSLAPRSVIPRSSASSIWQSRSSRKSWRSQERCAASKPGASPIRSTSPSVTRSVRRRRSSESHTRAHLQ